MTDTQRETLRTAFKIAGLVLVGLIGWAAARYDASKLNVARFVAESARRDLTFSGDHDVQRDSKFETIHQPLGRDRALWPQEITASETTLADEPEGTTPPGGGFHRFPM